MVKTFYDKERKIRIGDIISAATISCVHDTLINIKITAVTSPQMMTGRIIEIISIPNIYHIDGYKKFFHCKVHEKISKDRKKLHIAAIELYPFNGSLFLKIQIVNKVKFPI